MLDYKGIETVLTFGDIHNSEKIIKDTWNNFRELLKNKEFLYFQTEKAKQYTFLKVFNDLFFNNGGIKSLVFRLKRIDKIKNLRYNKLKFRNSEVLMC